LGKTPYFAKLGSKIVAYEFDIIIKIQLQRDNLQEVIEQIVFYDNKCRFMILRALIIFTNLAHLKE
jgi:hypothetical protein